MHPRHLAAPLAALALALCLGACTDDPEPKVEDPPSSSSTPSVDPVTSATPTSEPTSEPPADETPEEFVRRWQRELDAMQNSGDPETFLAMTRSCVSCNDLAEGIQSYYADGGYVNFAGTRLISIRSTGGTDGVRQFEVARRVGNTEYVTASGEAPQSLEGGRDTITITVAKEDDAWVVTRYAILD
ncbi:hypothetical protein FE634_12705 [Nocardioides dongxiaopingii]|uniref:hypothetical protein n=1 Tax=Nocardioides sp. S-1144 TaxID=2582905 RepID=UPI00110E164B|nr:hypothetical protein [Nocardioides sp. S-1144]QCW51047.1 hypothetical protein FE634_12705 [Nocardioides sp. S-1144]